MANLPSSGPLSILSIKNLFGGPASPSMANYYRGGAYIPATKVVGITVNEGPFYSSGTINPQYVWLYNPNTPRLTLVWNFSTVYDGTNASATSQVVGSVTYFRGAQMASSFGTRRNQISRSYPSTTTVSINTGIPSSGTISISQFYGAEKP